MDKVEISDEQIVSIDAIAEGLSGLKDYFRKRLWAAPPRW